MTVNHRGLDHAVVNVRDRMDEAVETYRRLGFFLTERGHHSLGSINHLMILGPDYLELVGFPPGRADARPDIAAAPVGLNGLVFRIDDEAATASEVAASGVAAEAPVHFDRPVRAGGADQMARFSVVRIRSDPAYGGRVYFCRHRTPELVWRDEWRNHPNGALRISGLIIAAHDPDVPAETFRRMFGAAAVRAAGGTRIVTAGQAEVELAPPDALRSRYGDAAADAAGRPNWMAGLRVAVRSLDAVRALLAANGVEGVAVARDRIVVPARSAMNTTLEFAQA